MPAPKALIFDMDGTLADTAPLWRAAEDRLFACCGQPWTYEVQRQCLGMNARDLAAKVHDLLQPPVAKVECQRVMRDALVAAYESGEPICEIPGAVALVRRLAGRVPMAVASGSPAEGIRVVLRQLDIEACFDLQLSSETVARGKPHPDVFLAAADRLGIAPADCLVFEDSRIGSLAAMAANMRCIARPPAGDEPLVAATVRLVASWDDVLAEEIF